MEIIEAIEKGDIEVVKQHLAAGTDVNAKNNFDMTPLDVAEKIPLDSAKSPAIADLLRKR